MLVSTGVFIRQYLQTSRTPRVTSTPTPTGVATKQFTQAVLSNISPTLTKITTSTKSIQTTLIPSQNPIGKIVFTCQLFKDNNRNQICIINADGADQRRLTSDDQANHFYPAMAPSGESLVFSSNQSGEDEIYEMDLSGHQTQLTFLGNVYAPEISPDGKYIAFYKVEYTFSSIWIMDRDGSNPHPIYSRDSYESISPTWSPDSQRILFAHGKGNEKKLYTVDINGADLELVSDQFITRGRSDWSLDGMKVAGDAGADGHRKIYIMNLDGSDLFALFSVGNARAPSFSPDGAWITFTGNSNQVGDANACEIYIMKLTDTEAQRLTDNDYCDWQPRWGP